jgi:hypothetical protein
MPSSDGIVYLLLPIHAVTIATLPVIGLFLTSTFGAIDNPTWAAIAFTLVVSYFTAVFINWAVQQSSCNKVSVGHLFRNAAAVPIVVFLHVVLPVIFPWARTLITNFFPDSFQEPVIKEGSALAYYAFFGGLTGTAISAFLSRICI